VTSSSAATPPASGTPDKPAADCFTIGVLVGAVEGDVTGRFGSLGGLTAHASVALQHGLIQPLYGQWLDLVPTELGRALFDRHNLAALPVGRAYLWPPSAIAGALAELNGEV
jgi:hypothetical protein